MATAATATEVSINDNIHKIDEVLNALNFLLEEVQTRKDQIVSAVDVGQKVKDQMFESGFKQMLSSFICDEYRGNMYQEVAFKVMAEIDDEIEKFIHARVDERLRELGVIPAQA
jgi:hypothetical protein